jgi:hypothetical protein
VRRLCYVIVATGVWLFWVDFSFLLSLSPHVLRVPRKFVSWRPPFSLDLCWLLSFCWVIRHLSLFLFVLFFFQIPWFNKHVVVGIASCDLHCALSQIIPYQKSLFTCPRVYFLIYFCLFSSYLHVMCVCVCVRVWHVLDIGVVSMWLAHFSCVLSSRGACGHPSFPPFCCCPVLWCMIIFFGNILPLCEGYQQHYLAFVNQKVVTFRTGVLWFLAICSTMNQNFQPKILSLILSSQPFLIKTKFSQLSKYNSAICFPSSVENNKSMDQTLSALTKFPGSFTPFSKLWGSSPFHPREIIEVYVCLLVLELLWLLCSFWKLWCHVHTYETSTCGTKSGTI